MLSEKSGVWPVCGVERSYLDHDVNRICGCGLESQLWSKRSLWIGRRGELSIQVLKINTGYRSFTVYLRYEVPPRIMPSSAELPSSARLPSSAEGTRRV